jgi:COP9 signalosome complex subunit 7
MQHCRTVGLEITLLRVSIQMLQGTLLQLLRGPAAGAFEERGSLRLQAGVVHSGVSGPCALDHADLISEWFVHHRPCFKLRCAQRLAPRFALQSHLSTPRFRNGPAESSECSRGKFQDSLLSDHADRLQPFLALSKSASSPRAAIDLISRATSASNTFIFTELLQSPNIQALSSSPEYVAWYQLLQIFCYGTYAGYKSTAGLPELNPAQTQKLKQLSLLSLYKSPSSFNYASLKTQLDISSTRDLENLVISAIYAGLLEATLDPHNQQVHVSSIAPLRDVAPASIPSLINSLNEWSARCTSTLSTLETHIAKIRADAAKRHKEETEWNADLEQLMATETETERKDHIAAANRQGGGRILGKKGGEKRGYFGVGGGGSARDDADMDLDDDDEEDDDRREAGAKSLKKRTIGGISLGLGR